MPPKDKMMNPPLHHETPDPIDPITRLDLAQANLSHAIEVFKLETEEIRRDLETQIEAQITHGLPDERMSA